MEGSKPRKGKWYKFCFVPRCTNTGFRTPEKVFFNVPKDPGMRKKWCLAARREKPLPGKSVSFCCEDHFKKLVKRMKKEAGTLKDEDVILLIRSCLHAVQFFAQKLENGEYLVKNLLSTAKQCYIESISSLPLHQNQIITISVIRFLHEDDRWNSCDFGVKALKTLMTERGKIHVENVEGDIFLTFVAHIISYCPGLAMAISSLERGPSTLSLYVGLNSSNHADLIVSRRNPILEMARVLYGMLGNHEFKDFGEDTWVAFDALLTIYEKIVQARDSGNPYEDESMAGFTRNERENKKWDMAESAFRGCLKNFVDDVLVSDLRFKPVKKPVSQYKSAVDETAASDTGDGESVPIDAGYETWNNMSQVLIAVLSRTIEREISLDTRYQLLDIIVMATRKPLGNCSLSDCLPDSLLLLIFKVARQEDSGANLRSLKLVQHIVDRHAVRFHLPCPKIFKEVDTHFMNVESQEDDLEYFRLHQEDVLDALYNNFLTHSNNLVNLEALFCIICLILIEIQFPLIARAIAELMVNIQDAIVTMPNLPIQSPRVSAWIHSTVISVLSFIATIHGLIELETLVSDIVNRRSEVAPFLIPPLKVKHTIGDITDFKEDLFFSHALVRRCLTNACFENRRVREEKDSFSTPGSPSQSPDEHSLVHFSWL